MTSPNRAAIAAFWLTALNDLDGSLAAPCLEWPGSRSEKGYGRCARGRGTEISVSRAVWVELFGPIAEGALVCHHCDNPPCGRASHLFVGTPADNCNDMLLKGRHVTLAGDANPRTTISDDLVESLRRRYVGGARASSLAREIGVHPSTVSRICRGLRRTTATPVERDLRPPADYLTPLLVAAYSAGTSTVKLAEQSGIDASTVYRRLAAAGVEMRTKADYAVALDAQEVSAKYAQGSGLKALAREYRVEPARIARLVRSTGTAIRRPGRQAARDDAD